MAFIEICDLHACVDRRPILKGVTLSIAAGEVHAIMGPNGAGKSTLSYIIAGRPGYEVTAGTIRYDGRDLLTMAPEERACAGLFLAFQYPVGIPGVSTTTFLKTAVNAQRRFRGMPEIDAMQFLKLMREKTGRLGVNDDMLRRALNVDFSGGEKKRTEILQMAILEPRFAVLDETDSGLDIDALKIVAGGVNALRSTQRAFLVITHYQRLLDYIVPDHVHVLADGRIVYSGNKELALELESSGYAPFTA
ncbi:Iron-sulfur cluster assembly ATPase protein SufC [invertebrate metagenome]|uniref:Iron-sulfur cluster assembly ATPase protein SufC n=1 Tax=invertebrate metagenome TaxID=1711999 RepID=A0A484HC14_9ZZZZ